MDDRPKVRTQSYVRISIGTHNVCRANSKHTVSAGGPRMRTSTRAHPPTTHRLTERAGGLGITESHAARISHTRERLGGGGGEREVAHGLFVSNVNPIAPHTHNRYKVLHFIPTHSHHGEHPAPLLGATPLNPASRVSRPFLPRLSPLVSRLRSVVCVPSVTRHASAPLDT